MNICNLGEAKVLTKFVELGIPVFIPFGDGSVVDLIADFNGKLNRIQVKSTAIEEDGCLTFSICSTTVRVNGELHKHIYSSSEIDYFALYSSITDKVYLLSIKDAPMKKFSLRYKEPYHSKSHKASEYEIENVLSGI